jgi:hypothetical protein
MKRARQTGTEFEALTQTETDAKTLESQKRAEKGGSP